MATFSTNRRTTAGFTLIEMVAVLLILSILAAATTAGLARAKDRAWRAQARETCRQLCEAWNQYLLDERAFPSDIGDGRAVTTTFDNLRHVTGYQPEDQIEKPTGTVYFEINEKERKTVAGGGLRDHWKGLYRFTLDMDYDGEVENPHPEAFADSPSDASSFAKVKAASIAWSEGDPAHARRKTNPIVAW